MTDFQIKRLPYNLTSQAGLSLVGQYLKRYAQIDQVIDPRFPLSGQGGIATSSIVKAYVGLLCTAKSDFDAIETLRRDAFFHSALGLVAIPSSPTLRQRLDSLGETGDGPLIAELEKQLRGQKKLLILDNFEQVMEAAVPIAELLQHCPELKLLAEQARR